MADSRDYLVHSDGAVEPGIEGRAAIDRLEAEGKVDADHQLVDTHAIAPVATSVQAASTVNGASPMTDPVMTWTR